MAEALLMLRFGLSASIVWTVLTGVVMVSYMVRSWR